MTQQLAQLDPDGQAFRYFASRDGGVQPLPDVDQIDLVASHEAMLGGVACQLTGGLWPMAVARRIADRACGLGGDAGTVQEHDRIR